MCARKIQNVSPVWNPQFEIYGMAYDDIEPAIDYVEKRYEEFKDDRNRKRKIERRKPVQILEKEKIITLRKSTSVQPVEMIEKRPRRVVPPNRESGVRKDRCGS